MSYILRLSMVKYAGDSPAAFAGVLSCLPAYLLHEDGNLQSPRREEVRR